MAVLRPTARLSATIGVEQNSPMRTPGVANRASSAATTRSQVAVFVLDTLADMLARPGFIDINLRPSPYVIQQMNGAYYWLPGFLGSEAPLATRSDPAVTNWRAGSTT